MCNLIAQKIQKWKVFARVALGRSYLGKADVHVLIVVTPVRLDRLRGYDGGPLDGGEDVQESTGTTGRGVEEKWEFVLAGRRGGNIAETWPAVGDCAESLLPLEGNGYIERCHRSLKRRGSLAPRVRESGGSPRQHRALPPGV